MAIGGVDTETRLAEGRTLTTLALFIVGSAAFYALTMVLMKFWGTFPPVMMAVLIGAAFAFGAWCEIEALKVERMSAIYIAILGVECVIITLISFAILGEQVSAREVLGGVLILGGVALAAA